MVSSDEYKELVLLLENKNISTSRIVGEDIVSYHEQLGNLSFIGDLPSTSQSLDNLSNLTIREANAILREAGAITNDAIITYAMIEDFAVGADDFSYTASEIENIYDIEERER